MLGSYDIETRSFNTRGWGHDAISKLSGVSVGETIHELYWKSVLTYYRKTNNPKVGAALNVFNDVLTRCSVPHRLGAAPEWTDLPSVTPTGTTLRGYQLMAVPHLMRGSMLLGDDMGLGKTLTCLWAWHLLNSVSTRFYPLTVVAPSDAVADEWVISLKEHLGITEGVIHVKKQIERSLYRTARVIIIPYSRYWREGYYQHIERRVCPESVVIFDEAHRLSNVHVRQHAFAYQLCLKRPWRWALSGTEVSNTPHSYYGIYRVMTLSKLPETAWLEYVYNTWTKTWQDKKIPLIRVIRKSFALRRTRSKVGIKLPPLTEITRRVELDPTSAKIYNDLKVIASADIETMQGEGKTITPVNWMVVHMRLMQLCSHPSLIDEGRVDVTPKLEALLDLLEEAGDQKVIVWSNFPKAINWLFVKLCAHFPGKRIAFAHGGVSQADRQEIKHDFQRGEVDYLIANPAVWAEGVNLIAATINVYWDYHASRVRWEQSKKRSHRIGQTKPVTLVYLTVKGSVEEKLIKWLERKTELAELITGR